MARTFVRGLGLIGLGLSSLAVGCGPVSSTARILAAEVEVDAAAGASADSSAIYEMTKAREYLHKAREEQGYADYEVAVALAEQATSYGEQAKMRAREHPSAPLSPGTTGSGAMAPGGSGVVGPVNATPTPPPSAPIIVPPPPVVAPGS